MSTLEKRGFKSITRGTYLYLYALIIWSSESKTSPIRESVRCHVRYKLLTMCLLVFNVFLKFNKVDKGGQKCMNRPSSYTALESITKDIYIECNGINSSAI